MRIRLFALASSFALLGAAPCLALTISSAPPNRDVALHLKPATSTGPNLQDTYVGFGGRPQTAKPFSAATTAPTVSSYGFGSMQTTVRSYGRSSWGSPSWSSQRDTPAPMSLSPPRR